MLQIKNTLGGGKPEGLYAWKKSSVVLLDSITTKVRENYELGTATFDTTVYYSTSYTFDEATGIYTLVNPQSANLAYNGSGGVATVSMEKSTYYIWDSTSSDKIYTTNDGSTYNVGIKNVGGSVYLESTATNEKYDIHSAKAEYTFLDYIVSDKETAYPDGGEQGGYYYERVAELNPQMFGYTKMAVDTFTPSSDTLFKNWSIPHSLGEIPKFVIIRAKSITSYVTTKYAETWNFGFLHNPNASSSTSISMSYTCIYYNSSLSQGHDGLSMLFSSTAIMGGSSVSNTIYLKSGVEYEIITMA